MKARDFFKQPYITDDKITQLKGEIQRLNYLMLPGGIDYSRPQVMTTPKDIMQEYATEKADLERQLASLQQRYFREKKAVKKVIEAIEREDAESAILLKEHYINHIPVSRIARDRHYNRTALYKTMDRALRLAQKHI